MRVIINNTSLVKGRVQYINETAQTFTVLVKNNMTTKGGGCLCLESTWDFVKVSTVIKVMIKRPIILCRYQAMSQNLSPAINWYN